MVRTVGPSPLCLDPQEAAPAPKHTPGPWAVWSSLYEGMAAAVVSGHALGAELKTIAEVRDYRDALLLAAAPELLAACREAREWLSEWAPDCMSALDAAIAKATAQ